MLLLTISTSVWWFRHIFGLTNQDRIFLIYPENLNGKALLFLAFENLTYLSEMFFFFLESLQTFIYCIPVLICFLLSSLSQRRHGAIRDIVRERTKSQRCPEQHRRCLSAVRDIVIVIHWFFFIHPSIANFLWELEKLFFYLKRTIEYSWSAISWDCTTVCV